MDVIALAPALLAFFIASRHSVMLAFVWVYLPTLLLLPDYYRWVAAGLPDPNFNQAALLAIFAVWVARNRTTWRPLDLVVAAFAAVLAVSQFLATGYKDAQNLIFDVFSSILLPYLLARSLLKGTDSGQCFARNLVLLLALIAPILLYEFRFGVNLFQVLLAPFFPDIKTGWVTNIRWGYGRGSGPFGHAILCGLVFAVGLVLQYWLHRVGAWSSRGLSWAINLSLLAGLASTLSRGPWLGASLGLGIASIGLSRDPRKLIIIGLLVAIPLGPLLTGSIGGYLGVERAAAVSETQETAAYRAELFDRYLDIALERPWWGWGLNTWPQIPGMPSIDNHYLNLALRHGVLATALFGLIVVTSGVLLGRLIKRSRGAQQSMAWALLGAQVAVVFAIATVYLGEQARPIFFLLIGWAAGASELTEPLISTAFGPTPTLNFRRVLC